MNAPKLTQAQQYVKDQRLQAATHGLRRARAFVAMHRGTVGFKSTMRSYGAPPVVVRWDDDGALRCYDATSFELMYQSEPGHIERLAMGEGSLVR